MSFCLLVKSGKSDAISDNFVSFALTFSNLKDSSSSTELKKLFNYNNSFFMQIG